MAATIEERLQAIEIELESVRAEIAATRPRHRGTIVGHTAPDFLQRIAGKYTGDSLFEEAVKYGREWRESFRPDNEEKS